MDLRIDYQHISVNKRPSSDVYLSVPAACSRECNNSKLVITNYLLSREIKLLFPTEQQYTPFNGI